MPGPVPSASRTITPSSSVAPRSAGGSSPGSDRLPRRMYRNGPLSPSLMFEARPRGSAMPRRSSISPPTVSHGWSPDRPGRRRWTCCCRSASTWTIPPWRSRAGISRRGGRAVVGVARAHAAAARGPGRRAARPDGPDGRVLLRPPALLRGPARRRHSRRRAVYLECRVPGVRPGAAVTYHASVTVGRDSGDPVELVAPAGPARRRPAIFPRRGAAHRDPGAFQAGRAWVLHHRRAAGFGPVPGRRRRPGCRRSAPERAELAVQVGDRTFDLGGGPPIRRAAGRRRGRLGHASRCRRTATGAAAGHGPLPRRRAVAVDLADRVGVG